MSTPEHYVPVQQSPTFWRFTTPTGEVNNIISEDRAKKLAKAQEEQDREEARTNFTSPIATVLRKHFESLNDSPPDKTAGDVANPPGASPVASGIYFDPDTEDFPDNTTDWDDSDETDDCGMHPSGGRYACGLVGSEECEFCPNRRYLGRRTFRQHP